MAFPLSRIKSLFLGMIAASMLLAQVDPKLTTTTDLLDVYKTGGGTPELLTVFDFSGSMQNIFWHKDYWTDLNSDSGNQVTVNPVTGVVSANIGNGVTATGFLVEPSGAKITTLPITAAVVRKASHARLTASMTSGTKTYTRTVDIPIPWTIFQVPASLPAAGTNPVPDYFVDPSSGAAVEFDTVYSLDDANIAAVPDIPPPAPITGATWSSTARRTTYITSSDHGLGVGDTVTITGVSPAAFNGTFTVSRVDSPTQFRVNMSSNPGSYSSGGTAQYILASANYRIGLFTYNADYIFWLFFGNVIKAADGNSYNTTPVAGVKDDRNQAPPGGVFDTNTSTFAPAPFNGFYPAGGGYVIPGVYDPSSGNSTTPSTTEWADKRGTTFNNGIRPGTRAMYLKKAVLTTWLTKQEKVLWAYRFLDTSEPGTNSDAANFGTGERYLTQFKTVTSGIHASVSTIQVKKPNGSTPLSNAIANAYAQMVQSAASGSVFDTARTGVPYSPCASSFVILFTDGMANDSNLGTAEVATNATTVTLTEANLQALPYANLNPGTSTSNFNIWSLAAVAAHGLDNGTKNASQRTTGTGSPSQFAPFRVMTRGADGTAGRKITTMTVGLSLAGTNTSAFSAGGKGPLLRTALYGDPLNTNTATKTAKFNLQQSVAYGKTPTGPDGIATNFFDASDPDALIGSLSAILARITQADTSITAPAAPLVGLNLGTRAYLGRFAASNDGQGSIWKGDLLMAGLGVQLDGTLGLKDRTGAFQIDINAGNAVASVAAVLQGKGWKGRNVYTMVPGTPIPFGGLDLTATNQAFSDQNPLLTPKVMGVSTTQQARSLIRFVRGAAKTAQDDTAASTSITLSRTDMMGDIINSSPAAVEFDPSLIPSGSVLATKWPTYAAMSDPRFQVIFVGDNQGHFHAIGEVSGIDAGVLKADLDELWSFVPPELLNSPGVATVVPKLSTLQTDGNNHVYTVDGSPYIYFKDSPLTGASTGNRRVDSSDTIRVIFGMRKGGRGYYALDVLNPGAPKLMWMLDPNTSADPTIKTMGLSTATPAVARVEVGSPAIVKDVVILTGGYSDSVLDSRTIVNGATAAKLGRSLLALDVLDGTLIKAYDFVNNASLATTFPYMGSISAGAFPFEFYVGSRKAQRVYFGDQLGGVYALGSMETLTTAPVGWRLDNSNIDQWTTDGSMNVSTTPGNAGIRWIYKGNTTVSSGVVTAASPITAVPVAYRIPKAIPQYRRPAGSTNAPNMIPPVVGVTFGTGERNNPMDLPPFLPPVGNAPYRQVMVFDRQDSADLPTVGGLPSNVNGTASAITDAQLSDQTATSTTGDTSYLGNNQYLGYYLRLHNPTTDPVSGRFLFEKSYLNSLVINGALIFTAFKPGKTGSTVVCEGAGLTHTWRMCDALVPVFGNGDLATTGTTIDKQDAGCSGFVFTWTNLAGDLTAIGSRMVLQSGQDTPSGTPTPGNVKIQDLVVPSGTQSFAPRAWRIIR